MNPRVFKPEGLKHLDRVIDLVRLSTSRVDWPAEEQCAKHGIYTVIDLHAAPGGQNLDWHADAGNNQANCERPDIIWTRTLTPPVWIHKDFQDRAVVLWEHLAEVGATDYLCCQTLTRQHYKDNKWVAGYNPLNEPTDETHVALLAFYERIEKVIRAIDQNHILFLE